MKKRRIVFACVENSCRSQIAEAIACTLYKGEDTEFASCGTDPADEVDPGALEWVYKESGIAWKGIPKSFSSVKDIDILVTMGCNVKCPYIPGVKTVEWDIPDPKGKSADEYAKVISLINKKVEWLIDNLDNL